jgi:hypothetical protein
MAPDSRLPTKIAFGLESTNMQYFQNAFFLDIFSVLQSLMDFFLNPKLRLVPRWRFCHFKSTLFSKNPRQEMTNTKTKFFMDLQSKYTQKNNQLFCK